MQIIILFISLVGMVMGQYQSIINNYTQYLQAWDSLTPKLKKIDAQHIGNPSESCNGASCPIYYYIREDQVLTKDRLRNHTVLIVGPLTGNDYSSPTAILNLYSHLHTARVIYFPLPNPSGFTHQQPQTYPNNVNPQQDFPLLGNKHCNQSSGIKILDHLYRTYEIDLTIQLKEGMPGITHSWTMIAGKWQTNTDQNNIYGWISQQLNQIYRKHPATIALQQLPPSLQPPLSLLSNSNKSQLVDWAYGASKYPQILTRLCNNKQFPLYIHNQMKGLVLALSLGTPQHFQAVSQAQSQNSLWDRTTHMVQFLINIINPRMHAKITKKNKVVVWVQGCKIAQLKSLQVFNQNYQLVSQMDIREDTSSIEGEVNLGTLQLEQGSTLPDRGYISLEYDCDDAFTDQGQTIFAQQRSYTDNHPFEKQYKTTELSKEQTTNIPKEDKIVTPLEQPSNKPDNYQQTDQQKSIRHITLIILSLMLCYISYKTLKFAYLVWRGWRANRLKQKFEKVEYVEYVEDDISSFSPRAPQPENRQMQRESNENQIEGLNKG